jgi:hypothetical protein
VIAVSQRDEEAARAALSGWSPDPQDLANAAAPHAHVGAVQPEVAVEGIRAV